MTPPDTAPHLPDHPASSGRASVTVQVRRPGNVGPLPLVWGECARERGQDGRWLPGAWRVTVTGALASAPPALQLADLDHIRALIVREMRDALDDARHRANDNAVAAAHATLCEVHHYLASAASTASIATQRERLFALRDRLGEVWKDQLKDLDTRLWSGDGGRMASVHDLQRHVEAAGLLRTLRVVTAALLFGVILTNDDKAAHCGVARDMHAHFCDEIMQRLTVPLRLMRDRIDREAQDSLNQSGVDGHWHLAAQRQFEEDRRAHDAAAQRLQNLIRMHAPLFDPDLLIRERSVSVGAWTALLSVPLPAPAPLALR